MNFRRHQRSLSAPSHSFSVSLAFEMLFLIMAGMAAVLLHAKLRIPLNLPGHHGLEFMALFTAARLMSNLPWAASLSSFGAASLLFLPVIGIKDPAAPLHFILPGLLLDGLFFLFRENAKKMLPVILFAGLAYMMIPLGRLITSLITGFQYMAFLKYGVVLTMASHFIFGLFGGLVGKGLVTLSKPYSGEGKNS